ncbi:hypothetical protein HMPREF1531_01005 [Propionibacterium sp. oral taxon 192 str. F0372]|uniref:zinc ribbon domain-containing protein n=1 Tax=Propionibacterium sp. oral taxon 192 TaxID=671222 RepID=UPI000354444E|nr:zinc ribbon domain-containing protein [Propionibacterium sp. oral taxon 192]EPH05576.1 hypothetical protein HMPREF1531_01005 [Propionibacterium sp. oral taxon 192 str. F0372]
MSMTSSPGKQCPQCGKMLPMTAAFCSMCATRQPATPGAAPGRSNPGASLDQAEDVGITLLFDEPETDPELGTEPEPAPPPPVAQDPQPAPGMARSGMDDDRTHVIQMRPGPAVTGGVVQSPTPSPDAAPASGARLENRGHDEPTRVIQMPSGPDEPTVVITSGPIDAPAPHSGNNATSRNWTDAGSDDAPTQVMQSVGSVPADVPPQKPAVATHLGNQPWQNTASSPLANETGWSDHSSGASDASASTPPRRPPVDPAPPIPIVEEQGRGPSLPSPVITGIVTFLFGIFGVIPAFISHDRAQQAGASSKRYWFTFGIFFVVNTLVAALLVVPAVSKALKGSNGASNPGVSAGTQPTAGGSASSGAEMEYPPGATECSATVAAGNAETSCEFSLAVEKAFLASPRASTQVVKAHSPVTHKDYEMTCVTVDITGAEHDATTCKGGNNAVVLIRS